MTYDLRSECIVDIHREPIMIDFCIVFVYTNIGISVLFCTKSFFLQASINDNNSKLCYFKTFPFKKYWF